MMQTEDNLAPLMRLYLSAVERLHELELADPLGAEVEQAADDVLVTRLELHHCLRALGWAPPADAATALALDDHLSRLRVYARHPAAAPALG